MVQTEFKIYTEEEQKKDFLANPDYRDKTDAEKDDLWEKYQKWLNGWFDVLDAADC